MATQKMNWNDRAHIFGKIFWKLSTFVAALMG